MSFADWDCLLKIVAQTQHLQNILIEYQESRTQASSYDQSPCQKQIRNISANQLSYFLTPQGVPYRRLTFPPIRYACTQNILHLSCPPLGKEVEYSPRTSYN